MMYSKRARINKAIRKSIDSYPGGICFATLDGMPILVNQQMNRLIVKLIGHTVMDASETWNDLKTLKLEGKATRLEQPWMIDNHSTETEQIFIGIDGVVWNLEKQILKEIKPNVIQISAVETTELYKISEELYENNLKLQAMQERQKELLENIVQINQEKELLETKAKIHDELGRCIIATRKALAEHTISREKETLIQGWRNTLRDLSNIPVANGHSGSSSALEELLQVSEMIGCKIKFTRPLPDDDRCRQLIFMAIREALTNAVRHGQASLLNVDTQILEQEYRVEITNNGICPEQPIREGGGLSSLRRRLEQEGADLEIKIDQGVCLIVTIHKRNRLKEKSRRR